MLGPAMYDDDYPTEAIGGGNPYYRCVSCKRSSPEINGNIDKHAPWCDYRISKIKKIPSAKDSNEPAQS